VAGLLSSRGRGIVLAGAPGVGKTRLGFEGLKMAAAQGFSTAIVMASRASVELPLGAMAPLLPPITDPGSGPADVLQQAAAAIARRGGDRPLVLLVDDAHLLDDLSATLVEQVTVSGAAVVIATLRSGEAAPAAILGLWKNELVDRLEVAPLDPDSVEKLLQTVLVGGVESVTVRRLAEACSGNALYLRELVLAALDSGVLANSEGPWRLSGPLAISPRLLELIDARLGVLAEAERHALELTAFGEPIEIPLIEALCGPETLETLERRGLVISSFDGRRLQARIAHPLYAEVVLRRLPATRTRAIKRALADWVEHAGLRRRDDALRCATWRLGGGGEVRADLMLAGAQAAYDRWDLPLAERLAGAAVEAGSGFPAAHMIGLLAWLQGRSEEAERRLAPLVSLAGDDLHRTMLASTRMDNLFVGLGRLTDAMAVGEQAEVLIGDQSCRDEITAQRARLLYLSGHTAAATELLDPLIARVEGRTLVSVCITGASCLGQSGRIAQALEMTERGYAAHLGLDGGSMSLGPYIHLVTRTLLLTLSGRLHDAEELGAREHAAAIAQDSLEAHAMFASFLARTMLLRGRPASAARYGREAVSHLRERRSLLFLRVALIPLAQALALLGAPDEAQRALDEAESLGLPPGALFSAELLQAHAWVEVALGDLPAARRILGDAANMARAGGDHVQEAAALHDLARLGQAKAVFVSLRQLARVVDGRLAEARAAHAEALAGENPTGLVRVCGDFEAMGATLLAAEAALAAAVIVRRRGEPRRATALERRAAVLSRRCEGAMTPALAPLESQALLTARELEVASLAVAGLSNREIAERLCLSVRTVENQLQRVYEKLGVARRAELADMLRP
jgi:ATP/maltotriose-dependent transcriptional regulator MalT